MTLPVMEPDLDHATLKEWAQLVDTGPFSSLCWGERIAFDNPESLTLLGAVAAWTDRVRLVTTVVTSRTRSVQADMAPSSVKLSGLSKAMRSPQHSDENGP